MGLRFRKRLLDRGSYEAATVFDVNNDGFKDIVCGAYWYEGPCFDKKHGICEIESFDGYYDDFANLPMDVNGDGRIDIITGGWWGQTLQWRENPGDGSEWKTHNIDRCGCIETIRLFDIDGCGVPEIFPNTPNDPQAFYKLVTDESGKGTGNFSKHVIDNQRSNHGLGFADINGDGRVDVILENGWLEQPEDVYSGNWKYHEDYHMGTASIPILALDVTGNGSLDLISGSAHNYGLYWWEQQLGADGRRKWKQHVIDDAHTLYHDMQLVDIDSDGELELVTGKRYGVHNGNDRGDSEEVFICYYKINGGKFERYVIDEGMVPGASGAGIAFWAGDLTQEGYPDIVAPGKDGLYLFENLGGKDSGLNDNMAIGGLK